MKFNEIFEGCGSSVASRQIWNMIEDLQQQAIRHKAILKQTLRVMKLTTIIMTIFLLQVSAASVAQITLKTKQESLQKVLKNISKQSGYDFIYADQDLKGLKVFNLNLNNVTIEQALKVLLDQQPVVYEISDRTVMLQRKEEKGTLDRLKDYFTVIDVRGKVVDESGQPLSGASIKVKGTNRSSSSDNEGNFFITGVADDAILVISFIGYSTREVSAKTELGSIALQFSDSKLDEVQIIAYGEVKKKYLTSNIGSVSAEQIAKQPITNPLLALQGRIPGLFIQQTSGNTLGTVNTLIQGQNSLKNGTDPFFVIDGIPFSPQMPGYSLASSNYPASTTGSGGSAFNFINPADIESIEILKDADATAIYGSRAANGAILITTKKGKAGRTKIDLNIQSGWGKIARKTDLLNTSQYLELRKEAYVNSNQPIPTSATAPNSSNFDLTIWDPSKNHDWQEELVGGTANFTDIQSSVSGGTELTQFLISAGYNKQTTVYPTDLGDSKYNLHLNLNHTSENQRFNINFNTSYLQSTNTLPSTDLMAKIFSLAPNAPDLYNGDGSINWGAYPNNPNAYSFGSNPVAFLLKKYTGITDNLLANTLLSYKIIPGLYIKSTFGYNMVTGDEILISPIDAIRPDLASRQGTSEFIDKSIKSYIIEPQLTYTKTTRWGNFDFLLGTTFQQSKTNVTGYSASGFSNSSQLSNISAATTLTSTNRDLQNLYRYNAQFARINYVLKNKYVLNLNARRDGSSRFGANNKFHNFYSAGAAWLFADEDWLKNRLPIISTGKLRVNYGTVGNDQLTDYAYASLLQNAVFSAPYQDLASTRPFRHSNPDLQWEETRKLNIGLDLGFLKDRVTFSGNWFRNRSSNQLIDYQLPAITGFATVTANFPATIQNTGFELMLTGTAFKSNDFDWSISANATIPRNKLVYFKDFETSTYRSTYIIGEPVNITKRFEYVGVDPNTGSYVFRKANGDLSSTPSSATDRTYIVDINPKWYAGLSNSFRYKNVSLDFLFQYVSQIGANDRFISGMGVINLNVPTYVYEQRWKSKGQITDVEKPINGLSSANNNATLSSAKFTDASYLRLKNASVSYTISKKTVNRIGLQGARIYVQGQNLLTFTDYRGIDPENKSYLSLPPLRMYTAGLQVTF